MITFLITAKRGARWNIPFRRFQLQSGCDSIAISTPRRTTETFPTPGDTIVLDDVARRRGETSSREEEKETTYLASRISGIDVPVDSFSRLMYSRDAEDFFTLKTQRWSLSDRGTSSISLLRGRSRDKSSITAGEDISQSFHESGKLMIFFSFTEIHQIEIYIYIYTFTAFFCNNSLCKLL